MPRRHAIVFLLALGLLGLAASRPGHAADAPPAAVPAEALDDSSVLTVWVDLEKVDLGRLVASSNALLGENAQKVNLMLMPFNAYRAELLKGGVRGATVVGRGPGGPKRPSMRLLLALTPAAKDDDARAAIAKITGADAQAVAAMTPSLAPGYLSLVLGREFPDEPAETVDQAARDRQKLWSAALASAGPGDAMLVFKGNATIVDELKRDRDRLANDSNERRKQVLPFLELVMAGAEAKHVAVAVTVGDKPGITLRLEAQDAAGARAVPKHLADATAALRRLSVVPDDAEEYVKRQASEMAVAVPLLDAIKPQVDGSVVTATLDTEALKKVVPVIANAMFGARAAAQGTQLANQMRQVTVALHVHLDQHPGKFPDKLEDMAESFGGGKEELARLLKHPVTGESPAFTYTKPTKEQFETNSAGTVVLTEVRGGKPVPGGWVAYLDGHIARTDAKAPDGVKAP